MCFAPQLLNPTFFNIATQLYLLFDHLRWIFNYNAGVQLKKKCIDFLSGFGELLQSHSDSAIQQGIPEDRVNYNNVPTVSKQYSF